MAQEARAGILKKAATLLRHRGCCGTPLNDILAAGEAPRGSLYFDFPGGKDQLGIEVNRAARSRSWKGRARRCALVPKRPQP